MSTVNQSLVKKTLFNVALGFKIREMHHYIVRNDSVWDQFVFKTIRESGCFVEITRC